MRISAARPVKGPLVQGREIISRALDGMAAMFAMRGNPQHLNALPDGEFLIRAHAMLASPERVDGTAFVILNHLLE
ncbi:hypothetical protein [Dyella humicola]|uniref:hypothetical protein n=1 Tax=Dyella humicola TaxID=2992126 RepID=UPI00224EF0C4|nr:hypothetical protein [Dyella humicola]